MVKEVLFKHFFFFFGNSIIENEIYYRSADWYKGILTDKQLEDLENPPAPSTQKPKVKKISSRRKHHQKLQQRQEEEEGDE